VEFRVLGPLEVDEDGEPLSLGGQKQRCLLAILILNANRVVSTDRLIDELWGGEAPETAQKALQVHISQLRKVLEPERASTECQVLVTRSPGYLLQVEAEQLDLGRFERLAAEGREALAGGDPELAAERLREALSLWRGAPLAEFAYADFAQREIARLEELRLVALEDRIEADLECGRHAGLIGELEQLIAGEPLRERPRAQLMLALYRSGRQAEALEAYRDARRTLTQELGIEPGRELKELEALILEQDPGLEAPTRLEPVLESSTQRVPPPPEVERRSHAREEFVGREDELRDLEVALEAALLGRGAVFLVGGEPGIGKSRLVDELSLSARSREAEVLWGRCWEAGGAPAYWPWVQALRTYVRGVDPERLSNQLGARGGEVAHILPELREMLPELPMLELPDSEGARFRLFDATASFLRRACAERPLVLVLEDLHAADVPSLLLLEFVAGEIAEARLLIIATYRDIELSPNHPLASALVELGRHPTTRTLLLRGFREADTSLLIEAIVGSSPSPRVASAIHAGTGGNPFFIGELVRLLASEERLDEPIDEASVRLAIPPGVRDVIDKRLRSVSNDSRDLLSTASALGREFTIEALAHVSGDSPETILELLDEPLRAGVANPAPGSGGLRMRFSHVLLRDALYDDLPASRRVQLHRRIGEALETLYVDDRDAHLAELAHHYFQAGPTGNPQKAYDYARRAGDRAARLFAYEEAVRLYQLAIRKLGSGAANDEERCRTLLALGGAQLRGGDEATAKETFLAAAELARGVGDAEALAHAALGYGSQYWSAARGDRRLIPLLEEALSSLEKGDSALRARVMARLACAVRDRPTRDRRLALSEEAVDMARRIGDPATQAYALAARCIALVGPDNLEALEESANEATRLGESAGESEAELTGHWWMHYFEVAIGNIRAAQRELETAIRLAKELREPRLSWYPAGLDAALALFEGRFDEAGELIAKAYELGRHALTFNAVASYRLQMFLLHKECGAPPYPEEALTKLISESETYVVLRCALASLLVERGSHTDADAVLAELARDDFGGLYVDEEWLAAMTLISEVCQSIGDAHRAPVLYRQLLPYRALNAWAFPEIVLGSVERPLGVLATIMERWEAAGDHFERAVEMNERMGAPPWVAHAQHDYARMLLARGGSGDPARAGELLSSALVTYRELRMEPWVKRAEAERERVETL
jgi:DNA-binding SARP family transcriptional activator